MPTLHCNLGNHDYYRDPQRGRKPLNCPEHQPEKPPVLLKKVAQLNAEPNPPAGVPIELREAMEAAELEMRTETLTCEVGPHEWQRERTRGKKPSRCPEHRASNFSNKPATKTTDHQARVIQSVLENPRAASCRCGITPASTPAEIRGIVHSCTDPWYICPTLDTVRRNINA